MGSQLLTSFQVSWLRLMRLPHLPLRLIRANPQDPNATPDPQEAEESDATDDIEDAKVTGGNQFKKHGRLKVKGRYIVDKNGKAFKLKGVSTHGIAWFPQYVNKSAFKSFKKWGANAVRLACYTSQGEQYNPSKDWKTIDKGVKAATELGMYVIIDWHILQENNPTMTTKKQRSFSSILQKNTARKQTLFLRFVTSQTAVIGRM